MALPVTSDPSVIRNASGVRPAVSVALSGHPGLVLRLAIEPSRSPAPATDAKGVA